MAALSEQKIEAVRGRLDPELSERLVAFWTRHRALGEAAARERVSEAVCVLLDRGGEIVGVNSVFAGRAPLVGRRFWIYRRFLAPDAEPGATAMMIDAAYEELAREYAGGAEEPEGLCALVRDRATMKRRPEAVWPGSGLLLAGYDEAGNQVRIRYFDRPTAPIQQTDERYRVVPFAEAEEVDEAAVLELWEREGAVPSPEDRRRRVAEVAMVAVDAQGALAGLSTVYLARSAQLRVDMWHYRTYVARAHRLNFLAEELLARTVSQLEERFRSAAETRAPGVLFELEHEGLKRAYPEGVWPRVPFTLIGENADGDHVRVLYFAGATVPPPG